MPIAMSVNHSHLRDSGGNPPTTPITCSRVIIVLEPSVYWHRMTFRGRVNQGSSQSHAIKSLCALTTAVQQML